MLCVAMKAVTLEGVNTLVKKFTAALQYVHVGEVSFAELFQAVGLHTFSN